MKTVISDSFAVAVQKDGEGGEAIVIIADTEPDFSSYNTYNKDKDYYGYYGLQPYRNSGTTTPTKVELEADICHACGHPLTDYGLRHYCGRWYWVTCELCDAENMVCTKLTKGA